MSTPRRSVVPPTSTHESYHPGGYGVSEGLKRARRPFLVKNILTGGVIMSFAVGVYWYSISKVRQDDFSDLADVRALGAGAPPASAPQVPSIATPVHREVDSKHPVAEPQTNRKLV
ncbi:hypothetical protein CBS101457_002724 [Exobasidium rhododendri]|nr:hypothetical protein CBS101457_002724 [Exobasidium rhododendri]